MELEDRPYADALERGAAAAAAEPDALAAVMAIVRPVVECNRARVDNGRAYLREIVFGDPEEIHHRDALMLTVPTEQAIGTALERHPHLDPAVAATVARVVSAVMFVAMAATVNAGNTVEQVVDDIRGQIQVLLPR